MKGHAPPHSPQYISTTTVQNAIVSNVYWGNTPSSTTKRVTLRVNYKYNGTSAPQIEKTLDITVKYLSTPSSLNIGGVNFGQGYTKIHSCGTASLTISAPPVTTEPAASVTYYWTYPAGWSGPATSTTPLITVVPNQNSSGTILLKAKRSDATVVTGISVGIDRPLPTIQGISQTTIKVCDIGSTKSVSATGTLADKFIWTPSANVKINGSTSVQTVSGPVNIGATGNGSFTVKAFSTTCNIASVGQVSGSASLVTPPNANNLTYDFGNIPVNNITVVSPNQDHYITLSPLDVESHTWNPVWSSGVASGAAGVYRFDFQLQSGQSLFFSPLSLTNLCGTTNRTIEFWASWSLMAYPNPATEQLNLDLPNTDRLDLLPEYIELYSEQTGKIARSLSVSSEVKKSTFANKKIQFDVKDLARGTYYLRLSDAKREKQSERMRIVLK